MKYFIHLLIFGFLFTGLISCKTENKLDYNSGYQKKIDQILKGVEDLHTMRGLPQGMFPNEPVVDEKLKLANSKVSRLRVEYLRLRNKELSEVDSIKVEILGATIDPLKEKVKSVKGSTFENAIKVFLLVIDQVDKLLEEVKHIHSNYE